MPAIDCGIDIGSSNVKVVFVGEEGRVLYTRSIPSPRVFDDIGPITDPLALVQNIEQLIVEGWKLIGSGSPLRSIATAGVGEDGIGLREDLTPTGFALPWFDKRADAEAKFLQRYAHLSTNAGIAIDADRTAAKWLWLHRHRRQEIDDAAYWVTLTDFPSVWWSGVAFMSSSLAPRTACYDVYHRTWIDELLKAAHAPNLPTILNAGNIVGGVRNGVLRDSGAASAQTLIAAGGHDHPVAATMIQRYDPQARVDSMGTANLVYGETESIASPRLNDLLAYSIPPNKDKGIACLGVLELSAALAAIQVDSGYFRSYLAKARLPGSPPLTLDDLNNLGSTRDELIRRKLEAATFRAHRMLDAMEEVGVPMGAIYTTGGWSGSQAFVELRASIFGQAVNVIGDIELTAIGAALFGSEAVTGKAVSPLLKQDVRTIEPVAEWLAGYHQIYTAFKQQ